MGPTSTNEKAVNSITRELVSSYGAISEHLCQNRCVGDQTAYQYYEVYNVPEDTNAALLQVQIYTELVQAP